MAERTVSYRRLIVMLRHQRPDSAVALALVDRREPWTTEHELLDYLRRAVQAAWGVEAPPVHPMSPFANPVKGDGMTDAQRAARDRARARAEERQRRLEGGTT